MNEPIQIIDDAHLPLFGVTEENQDNLFEAHSHAKAQITYIETGLMKVIVGSNVYLIPSGFLIYIPANMAHSGQMQSKTRAYHLYLTQTKSQELPGNTMVLLVSGLLKELILKLTRSRATPENISFAYLEVLTFELLDLQNEHFYKLSIPEHPRLKKMLHYINTHLDTPLKLNNIAEIVHLSTRHLSRIFKEETGMAFSQWLQNYKALIAIKRLAVVKKTSVVARELGYDSDSAFIHMFKRLTGKKPSDFYSSE
ncbi:AraC family transcriptional regulator [Facilibium subflavum]|uniref:AraC family transcriptional regulator n=1 Tax=Facilibium subflavum TaxID=2219058 RepID=UPI000E6587B8|nr:helix-turn-helix transcriptional regulator [Facilibium subflavum]